jgi:hypothetical protein
MENRITKLENEIMELQKALIQITDKMVEMSAKINDIHSKPEPLINQLVLPAHLERVIENVAKTKGEKWLEEENIPSNYFFIRNDFPIPTVHYIDRFGQEKKVKEYEGYVYLGGDISKGIPGRKFDLSELHKKYFGNE